MESQEIAEPPLLLFTSYGETVSSTYQCLYHLSTPYSYEKE